MWVTSFICFVCDIPFAVSIQINKKLPLVTRILPREVLAVKEWLNSDKLFYIIISNHPYHNC